MTRGYFKLTWEMFDDSELTDSDREHIAEVIIQGCCEGELIHEDNE